VNGAVKGVRVLETAQHVAGPYCGKLLGDNGADVVKIEPPPGDLARTLGPFPGDEPHPERSGLFLHLNTSKRGVVLDLSTSEDADLFRRLARDAAVVVDDGALGRAGIAYEELAARNPRIVLVELSAFGQSGPYADFRMDDYVAYAVTGWMSAMGERGRPPVYPGRDYPFYVAGIYAAFGATLALLHALRTGQGQRVGVSVLDATISIEFYETTTYSFTGEIRKRQGNRIHGVAASLQPCSDGWVALTVNQTWGTFAEVIGAPELAEGRFATPQLRMDNADELERLVRAALAHKTVDQVVRECQAHRVAVSPVATTADILRSDQFADRGWFTEVDHPEAGRVLQTGPPFRLSACGWAAAPAPLLGQHSDEVLGALREEVAS